MLCSFESLHGGAYPLSTDKLDNFNCPSLAVILGHHQTASAGPVGFEAVVRCCIGWFDFGGIGFEDLCTLCIRELDKTKRFSNLFSLDYLLTYNCEANLMTFQGQLDTAVSHLLCVMSRSDFL